MESILGKKLIEVVPRHAPRDLRKTAAYPIRIPIADRSERGVNLSATSTFTNDHFELGIGRLADRQLGSVIKQDREVAHVVDGFACEQRMGAARVVADHAAEAAPAVCRWIGAECKLVLFGTCTERVQ